MKSVNVLLPVNCINSNSILHPKTIPIYFKMEVKPMKFIIIINLNFRGS